MRVDVLQTTLNFVGRTLRKYVILDACFAGEAAYTQSGLEDAVGQQIRRLPQRGAVYLCSSSKDDVSEFLPDQSNSAFTEALCEVYGWVTPVCLPSCPLSSCTLCLKPG